jgi:hypothetical protein
MSAVVGEDIDPRDVLPKECPSWCGDDPAGHLQTFHEIAGDDRAQAASVHMSGDMDHRLNTLVQPYTGVTLREGGDHWNVEVRAQGEHHWYGVPFIHTRLGTKDQTGTEVQLTSGEARKLARQLLHMADLIDLEP